MQTLEVISVNIWQILISLCNLLIMFLLLKKFLYKPVRKMLAERKNIVDAQYNAAREAENSALENKRVYEQKLSDVRSQADEMIKTAAAAADARGNKIVDEAKQKADGIMRQAHSEIELEKKKAADDMKREIADVSALLSEKVLEREINADDHRSLIDSFIEGMGDGDDSVN